MNRSTALPAAAGMAGDRLARGADRALRIAADARLAVALLLLAGAWNALAAALPDGRGLLALPAYSLLLGAVLLSGLAAFALRAPAAWREWRRPGRPPAGRDALVATLPVATPLNPDTRAALVAVLRGRRYRVAEQAAGDRWEAYATRRGWSRFAAIGSHVALVVLVVGAGLGSAFARETVFSLLPGEQALLDAPRDGFTDALRLERFDAEFGPDGRPRRLDTTVTFLRDGEPVRTQLLQVNRPAAFGAHLVHGWTYGPAVRLRVTTLAGRPLLDAPIALDGEIEGRPGALLELPSATAALGVALVDPGANQVAVSSATGSGVDAVRLGPGEEARVGNLLVTLHGFEAYVTFLSRSDPGAPLVFGGAALLSLSLAIAFWLPRRRIGLAETDAGLRLTLRGERFDQPAGELARIRQDLGAALR